MSEFTCSNGHITSNRTGYCSECGEKIRFMDGMSSAEVEARENDYEEPEGE